MAGIPTISHEQFDDILKADGVYGALAIEPYVLLAYSGDYEEVIDPEPKSRGLRVLMLNVASPLLYMAKDGKPIVILPHIASVTYDMLSTFHPEFHKDGSTYEPWLYKITPYIQSEMDEVMYYFRDGRDDEDGQRVLPKFNLADVRTH